jgi:hypothetical protein
MAITITKKPTNPCFSKNVIAYQVQTDTTLDVIAWVYAETSPYSNTYTFLTSIKAIPDEDGYCYFYLQDIMEQDVLNYHKPSFSSPVESWPNVCRQIKMSFYEQDLTNMELQDEVYSVVDNNFYQIEPLLVGEFYTIIADKSAASVTVNGGHPELAYSFPLQHSLSDEFYYSNSVAINYQFPFIEAKAGIKYTIYKGGLPEFTTNADRFALLGGIEFNRFTKLVENAVLWGQEDYDLIVDENGNFVGIS